MVMDFFKGMKDRRAEAQAARDSIQRQQAYEAQSKRRAAQERQQKIASVRVITGDLKHRYVIIDTVRGYGYYSSNPGADYDPIEATARASYHLQSQAADLGADAVIHATFNIIRYTEQRSMRSAPVPCYEVHAFGTAIRIVGPPADWPIEQGQDDRNEYEENSHTDSEA